MSEYRGAMNVLQTNCMGLQSACDGECPSPQQTKEGNQLNRRGNEDYVILPLHKEQTYHNTNADRDTTTESAGTDHRHGSYSGLVVLGCRLAVYGLRRGTDSSLLNEFDFWCAAVGRGPAYQEAINRRDCVYIPSSMDTPGAAQF